MDNSGYEDQITIGEIYKVRFIHDNEKMIYIIDDGGYLVAFKNFRFKLANV